MNRVFILILAAVISFSCKPKNKDSDSTIQGTRWQNCKLPEPEIRLWSMLFRSYLAKKFVRQYMSCSGKTITLSGQEMADLYAQTTNKLSESVQQVIDNFTKLDRKEKMPLPVSGKIGANSFGGTLGQFWVDFDGEVLCEPHKDTFRCEFEGIGSYSDFWDFDKKKNSRENTDHVDLGESRVQVAREWMSGKPFHIKSSNVSMKIVVFLNSQKWSIIELTNFQPKISRDDTGYSSVGECMIKKVNDSDPSRYTIKDIYRILTQCKHSSKGESSDQNSETKN